MDEILKKLLIYFVAPVLVAMTLTQYASASAYQQDTSSDNMLVFDAEHFKLNTAQGSHTWDIVRPTGYTGSGAVQASPIDGMIINSGYQANSPHLEYSTLFKTNGTHYVWVRGKTQGSTDDTVHLGLDGILQTNAQEITGFTNNWGWVKSTIAGSSASLSVPATGLHTIDLWMGKSGLIIDKIVLTTNPNYKPVNDGPVESLNGLAVPPGDLSGTIINDSVLLANQTYTVTANVTVQSGVLLTIQPGAKIIFSGNYYFYVDGALRALGTSANTIKFTSGQTTPVPGNWHGIYFRSNDKRNHLDHVDIKYAYIAIYFMGGYAAKARIYNSTIDQCSGGIAVTGNGVKTKNPEVIVNYNNLINISALSFQVTGMGDAANVIVDATNNWWGTTDFNVIQGMISDKDDYWNASWVNASTILDGFDGKVYSKELLRVPFPKNRILPENKYYVLIKDFTVAADESLTISKGVRVEASGAGTDLIIDGILNVQGDALSKVSFTSSSATPAAGNWGGIKIRSSMASNLIDNATIEYAIKGIDIQANAFVSITNSLIHNNKYGVYAQGNNQVAANPQMFVNSNNILNNTTYNFYANYFGNASNTILDLTNNWWGTTDFAQIHAKIYDNSDNPTYAPWVDIGTILDSQGTVQNTRLLHFPILQDTTLQSGSTYEIFKDFTVKAGATLTINPGTKLQVKNAATDFIVDGTIRVLGTDANPVIFTSNLMSPTSGSWQGIIIRSNSPMNLIDHAVIEYANRGVYLEANSFVSVTNSLVQNNQYGIYAQGNSQATANPQMAITNNKLINNTYYNFYANYYGNASTTILNLVNNWWGTTDFAQIHAKIYDNSNNPTYAPWVDTETILDFKGAVYSKKLFRTVTSNIRLKTGETYQFINNIKVPSGSTLTVESNAKIEAMGNYDITIDGVVDVQGTATSPVIFTSGVSNPIKGSWRGFVIRSNSPLNKIDHTVIEYGYYGVSFQSSSFGVVTNSVIQNNLYGLYIMGNTQVSGNPNVTVTSSSIIDNQYFNLMANYFGSASTTTINATGNWWGSTDLNVINASIYDNSDYPIYAPIVNIQPISTSPLWIAPPPPPPSGSLLPNTISSDTVLATGNTYRLESNLTVTAGSKLTIQPGVIILAKNAATKLIIDGVIDVVGTAANPVIFTSSVSSPGPGNWHGIVIRSNSTLNKIDYAVIEFSDFGIQFQAGSTGVVTNSVIHNNNYGIYVTGNNLSANNPTPRVQNNKIINNVKYNYYANFFGNAASSTLDAKNNWWGTTSFSQIYNGIFDNSDASSAPWIDVGTVLDSTGTVYTSSTLLYAPISSDMTLTSSTQYEIIGKLKVESTAILTVNAGTKLKFSSSDTLDVEGVLRVLGTSANPVVFTSSSLNSVLSYWTGIVINSNSTNNLIDHAVIEYAKTGIAFNPGSSGKVINSVIHNNTTGISATGDGTLINNPAAIVNNNSIINNTTQFSASNFADGANTILNAKNNWWGTTDFTQIHSKILDRGDFALTTTLFPWVDTSSILDSANGNVYSKQLFRIYTNSNQTLVAGQSYEMIRDVYVKSGATLTINNGVNIDAVNAELIVDGIINSLGTPANQVAFTSSIGTSRSTGWKGIKIRSNSSLNSIINTKVEYADNGLYFDWSSYATVSNSTFNFNYNGISIYPLSNPAITGQNIISQNSIGISVVGDGVGVNNPNPVISGNSIYSNLYWNYFAGNFGNAATTQLDANGNYWGSTNYSLVRNKIYDQSNITTSPWVLTNTILDSQGNLYGADLLQLPIKSSYTLDSTKKYQIVNDINISSGATLTIPAGTRLEFIGSNSTISVDGVINIQGTQQKPVIFTSSTSSPSAGDWKGIQVRSNSSANLIDNAIIEYASNGIDFRPGSSGRVQNSIIRNNTIGVNVRGDNTVANNPAPVVTGNQVYSNTQSNYFASLFANANSTVLDATGNWWGTTDYNVIHTNIYDQKDNVTAPWVDTSTILDSQLTEFPAKLLRLPISKSTILVSGQRYQMIDRVTVLPGATLTINAGARIEGFSGTNYQNKPGLDVDGVIIINGTAANPVVFTSALPTPKAGDWNGINIRSNSSLNLVDYTLIEYALHAVAFQAGSTGILRNSKVSNNSNAVYVFGDGNVANNPTPVVTNNSFTSNKANYYAVGFGDGANTVLNARNNWWGTTDFKAIYATILDHEDSAANQYPWVDASSILATEFGKVYNKKLLREAITSDLTLSANQNYEFYKNVTVSQGVTLTIQPGVRIEATEMYIGLIINGTIKANGTSASSIVFTSSKFQKDGSRWNGLKLSPTSINNELSYVVIEYATNGVYFDNTSGTLSNSLIQNNLTGVYIFGASNPILTKNTIVNNNTGIMLQGQNSDSLNPAPIITNNDIYNNSIQMYISGYGNSSLTINATQNWWGTLTPADAISLSNSNVIVDYTSFKTVAQYGAGLSGLIISNYYFSPNGDGSKDTTQISATLTKSASWKLDIRDSQNNIVNTINGVGGTVAYVWDGKNQSGVSLADGKYLFSITVSSSFGTVQVGFIYTELDSTYPAADILDSLNGSNIQNQLVFNINGTAKDSNFVNYKVEYGLGTTPSAWTIINATKTSQVNMANLVSWTINSNDGTVTSISPGAYSVRLTVTDAAGNVSADTILVSINAISITNVSLDSADINIIRNQSSTVSFTVSQPSTVTLNLYTQPTPNLVALRQITVTKAGQYSMSWDGKDNSGNFLPDDAYEFKLVATAGTSQAVYDTINTDYQTRIRGGSNYPVALPNSNFPYSHNSTYDTYKNEFWKIKLGMSYPGRIRFRIMATQYSSNPFYVNYGEAFSKGEHWIYWDGRDPNGNILTGAATYFFGVPIVLDPDTIIVKGNTPTITGFGSAPNIEVKSDPYLVTNSFEQISKIGYRIDQDSIVSFMLLPPNVTDINAPSAIVMLNNVLKQANDAQGKPIDHVVEWDGASLLQSASNNVTTEGAYTFVIEATSNKTGIKKTYRGVIQLYQ